MKNLSCGRRHVALLIAFCVVLFASPEQTRVWAEDVAVSTADSKELLESFPLDLVRVPVELLGKKYQFLLDTGATTSILDDSFRDRLGPKIVQTPIQLASERRSLFDSFAAPEMIIGRGSLGKFRSTEPLPVIDLSAVRSATGEQEMGVLGMDFLKSHVVRLNNGAGLAEIGKKGSGENGERMQFSRGIPFVRARVSDLGFHPFMIDTGSNGEIGLEAKLFQQLVSRRHLILKKNRTAIRGDSTDAIRIGTLDVVEIASHEFHNVFVAEGAHNSIGLEMISRFDLELDFPGATACFRAGNQIDAPSRQDRAGFAVKRIQGITLACDIEPAGNADHAGLKNDDKLISLNNVPAETLSIAQIRRLRSDPKSDSLTITYKRGDATATIRIPLTSEPNPFPVVPR